MRRTTGGPARTAGGPVRPGAGRHRWAVLLLVLGALFGAGAAGALGGGELRPATAAPASDAGGETHEPAAGEVWLPGRARRHRRGVRPASGRRRPRGARGPLRDSAPTPVPAPRGDALGCVVMRC
ncbi:hypothetical protein [Streptomyces sp. NPDC093089]|uniref:hypothetical protein n=1 Tax=Streptomyces sp. NPDC093089 TaxID=3366024 RepID=UPI00382BBC94